MCVWCHKLGGGEGRATHSWTDYKATPIQTASFYPVQRGKKETHPTSKCRYALIKLFLTMFMKFYSIFFVNGDVQGCCSALMYR